MYIASLCSNGEGESKTNWIRKKWSINNIPSLLGVVSGKVHIYMTRGKGVQLPIYEMKAVFCPMNEFQFGKEEGWMDAGWGRGLHFEELFYFLRESIPQRPTPCRRKLLDWVVWKWIKWSGWSTGTASSLEVIKSWVSKIVICSISSSEDEHSCTQSAGVCGEKFVKVIKMRDGSSRVHDS